MNIEKRRQAYMNIRIVKLIKLNVIFTYSFWFFYINARRFRMGGSLYSFKMKPPQTLKWHSIYRRFKLQLKFINKHRDVFINDKHGTAVEFCVGFKTRNTITELIKTLAFIVWLCEKMEITNIKFRIPDKDVSDLFECASITTQHQSLSDKEISWPLNMIVIGGIYIPSAVGYTMFSKLPIRKELKQQADDWLNRHIRGDWVAVHYRGTDIAKGKNDIYKYRYLMEPNSYIIYLKEVLDSRCRIFVCSDQAQFIDMMEVAFPGRVFARDIQRSDSDDALHLSPSYRGRQQKRDALIDMLILAKAELIYTTGSSFVGMIRFFNPKIKIVSLCGAIRPNYVPIPRKDLYDSLRIKR